MNYITQEQAEAIATKYALPQGLGKPHWPVIFNEVIKHYIDSRPAPPRPVYGAVGTKDTEVAAAMAQWDAQYAQPAKPVELTDYCSVCGEVQFDTPSGVSCTNGDQYQESPAVVLWRTE